MDVVAAVTLVKSSAKTFAEHVGVIRSLVDKLKRKPDLAVIHLTRALEEISKTCQVVDEAIVAFAGLADQPSLATLARLRGGSIERHVTEGRGHCQVVEEIYDKHLDRWFLNVFGATNESITLKTIFAVFGTADLSLFNHAEDLARALQGEANLLLSHFAAGKVAEVRAGALDVYLKLAPAQEAMNHLVAELAGLKNELIAVTVKIPYKT